MANFQTAFSITMGHEGGYANNQADAGGETYKGIARNFNPDWSGWRLIDAAKKQIGVLSNIDAVLAKNAELQADVLAIYKLDYWDVNRLDAIINQDIANRLFDIGVNSGVGTAAKTLQEALNLTNRNCKKPYWITQVNHISSLKRNTMRICRRQFKIRSIY